jgi:hypothetical protein
VALDDPQQRLGVQVVGYQIGQLLEASLSDIAEDGVGRDHELPSDSPGRLGKERPSVGIVLEQPVPRSPHDRPGPTAYVGKERGSSRSAHNSMVNLVPLDDRPVREDASGTTQDLLGVKRCLDREKTETFHKSTPALDLVFDRGAQHLVPTADTENGTPGRGPLP